MILITGGLGFVGTNLAEYFLAEGHPVTLLDNCSRPGALLNYSYLRNKYPTDRLTVRIGDILDAPLVEKEASVADAVFHLAAQVAVTTSVVNPVSDFEINARGTLNVLEAVRKANRRPLVVFPSTNKVYGGLEDLEVCEATTRYECPSLPNGVPESRGLDFHSPYGCSKGAADQYVRDYSRIYGFPTVVLRLSCIYGPRQWGIGDQGWVGWFLAKAALKKPLAIYGDGKQVRDLLWVGDLCQLCGELFNNRDKVSGRIFNVGGGASNSLSVWHEFQPMIERLSGESVLHTLHDWRPGDQRWYVSDIDEIERVTGWRPRTNVIDGIERLWSWVKEQVADFNAPELGGAYAK